MLATSRIDLSTRKATGPKFHWYKLATDVPIACNI